MIKKIDYPANNNTAEAQTSLAYISQTGRTPARVPAWMLFAVGLALFAVGLAISLHGRDSKSAGAPVATVTPAASAAAPAKNASLDPSLDDADIGFYSAALAAQKKANWAEADSQIAGIANRVLVSSLLADRYQHPKYTSRFDELEGWLASNPGHPDAGAILNLVRAKFPKEAKRLPAIQDTAFSARPIDDGKASILRIVDFAIKDANPLAQRVANKALVTMETSSPDEAFRIINNAHAKHLIGDRTRAILLGRMANNQFRSGNFTRAYQLASSAAAIDEPFAAHQWLAGISAVHMKQTLTAGRQFARLAKRDDLPVADAAAANYWAATMYRKTNRDQGDVFLEQAAKYDRTFYGILARKALGGSLDVAKAPTLDEDALAQLPGAARASAWVALGKSAAAESELTNLFANAQDADLKKQIVALAGKWDMPVLQMKMGASLRASENERVDFASYPTPGWKPNAGYAVDPALLYAIARQESKFDPDAKSPAGAMGVMQLMPTTAHYVAKNASGNIDRSNLKGRLSEPVTSIALGQEYLQYLMKKPYIDNNLMFVAAAYNAGPGKLSEWKERIDDQNNPLLFLESLSFTETRNYVQQVFVNYWVYSELMGGESPTLEALASNNWPLYEATNLEFAGLFEGRVN